MKSRMIVLVLLLSVFFVGCHTDYIERTTIKYPDGKVVVKEKLVPTNTYVGYLYNQPAYRRSQSAYPYYYDSFRNGYGYPVRGNNSRTIWSTGGYNCKSSGTSSGSSSGRSTNSRSGTSTRERGGGGR